MIAKLIKGKGFRGALEYDLKQGKGLLLETNMAGQTPKELAKEFGIIRALRPTLGKAVCHVSLSIHPTEDLTDEQWCEAAQRWLSGMGFTNNQYVVNRHTNTEHPHIHILVNRIDLEGNVVSDAHDYKRQETIMRILEKEWSLTTVPMSQSATRKAPTKGEVEQVLRTGESSYRMKLQQFIDTALTQPCTLSSFTKKLEQAHVSVRMNTAKTGFISGISFSMDGVVFKGSSLGHQYTWGNLKKRGLYHEQDRYVEEHECGGQPSRITGSGRLHSATGKNCHLEQTGRDQTEEHTTGDNAFERIAKLHQEQRRRCEKSCEHGEELSR